MTRLGIESMHIVSVTCTIAPELLAEIERFESDIVFKIRKLLGFELVNSV